MRIRSYFAVAALSAFAVTPGVTQAPDPEAVEAGRAKSITCAACHGADGNSINPEWPSLAGQHADYTAKQIAAYKNGDRNNVLMAGMVLTLTDEDMANLGAFYEAQTPILRTAPPETVEQGERIYRGGIPEAGVPACAACHGPGGKGNPMADYPVIRGQHATYLVATLKEYAAGTRMSDKRQSQMMRNIASAMTEEQMRAVAGYMQGLR